MLAFVWFILTMNLYLKFAWSAILWAEPKSWPNTTSGAYTLSTSDLIFSYNTLVRLKMQNDGNLVLNERPDTDSSYSARWSAGTNDIGGDHAILQTNGQLVVVDGSSSPVWTSHSPTGNSPFRLVISDDAAAYILDSSNDIVWSTKYTGLNTFFTESFDNNNADLWNVDKCNVSLPWVTPDCPNYPDSCVKVQYTSEDPSNCWTRVNQRISMFRVVILQVDIAGVSLEENDNDLCEPRWKIFEDEAKTNDDGRGWEYKDTKYPEGVFKDVIIEIPLYEGEPYLHVRLDLRLKGDAPNDRCFFDNVILRGIVTPSPTPSPTSMPTLSPTVQTSGPTTFTPSSTRPPTNNPTIRPTVNPTPKPTDNPTPLPTKRPTNDPSNVPSTDPSVSPTRPPSSRPTNNPTTRPTVNPTPKPTDNPTPLPTKRPTNDPSNVPSTDPSVSPTRPPSSRPTNNPTTRPTVNPTPKPTYKPTPLPT
eukprot:1047242_1